MLARNWVVATLLFVLVGALLSGCAAFLEDYQYNPAGPLYSSSSGN